MPVEKKYVGKKQQKLDAKAQVALDKRARDEEAARLNAAAKAQRDKALNDDVSRKREKDRLKQEAIVRIRAGWNTEINNVVQQVEKLRADNPGRQGINAGKNNGLKDTEGGTDNPVPLSIPRNDYNIEKSEVLSGMNGLDSSDSGLFKFRRKEILVHCK